MVVKDKVRRTEKRRGPRKALLPEDNIMGNTIAERTTDSANLSKEPDFPNEWISIAAYYIWKNDGQPEGRDAEYWERAKAELIQLRREGNLPIGKNPLDEER